MDSSDEYPLREKQNQPEEPGGMSEEKKYDLSVWKAFMGEVNTAVIEARECGLPLYLVCAGLLMSAAKWHVVTAKINRIAVPKIGDLWLRYVKHEEDMLAEIFTSTP